MSRTKHFIAAAGLAVLFTAGTISAAAAAPAPGSGATGWDSPKTLSATGPVIGWNSVAGDQGVIGWD